MTAAGWQTLQKEKWLSVWSLVFYSLTHTHTHTLTHTDTRTHTHTHREDKTLVSALNGVGARACGVSFYIKVLATRVCLF